jgi:hypothetical protein
VAKVADDVKVIEDVPAEVLASSIVALAAAAERMQNSGLNRRCLVTLLRGISGVNGGDINAVLDALPKLAVAYTTKPAKAKAYRRIEDTSETFEPVETGRRRPGSRSRQTRPFLGR